MRKFWNQDILVLFEKVLWQKQKEIVTTIEGIIKFCILIAMEENIFIYWVWWYNLFIRNFQAKKIKFIL